MMLSKQVIISCLDYKLFEKERQMIGVDHIVTFPVGEFLLG